MSYKPSKKVKIRVPQTRARHGRVGRTTGIGPGAKSPIGDPMQAAGPGRAGRKIGDKRR